MAVSSAIKLRVGDSCIIYVDDVNTPHGWWKGEVVSVEEHERYTSVTAKIVDGRLKDHRNPSFRDYYDRAPTVNYTVYPADPGTTHLVDRIQDLERVVDKANANAAVRVDTLVNALIRLFRDGRPQMTADEIRKLLKDG